jgi:hypothetical protein
MNQRRDVHDEQGVAPLRNRCEGAGSMILARSLSVARFPTHRRSVFMAPMRLSQRILPGAVRCGIAILRPSVPRPLRPGLDTKSARGVRSGTLQYAVFAGAGSRSHPSPATTSKPVSRLAATAVGASDGGLSRLPWRHA